MKVSDIITNKSLITLVSIASKVQPKDLVSRIQPLFKPVSRMDSLELGGVLSPYETYSATQAAPKNEIRSVTDFYKISADEVWPALLSIGRELDSTDFTGMTQIEIYGYIENKYEETLGKDFLLAYNLNLSDPKVSDDTIYGHYREIGLQFTSDLRSYLGTSYKEVNRQRLYGDMSISEVQDAVRAKYPERMTNKELIDLLADLEAVGADEGVGSMRWEYAFEIANPVGARDWSLDDYECNRRLLEKLDQPADPDILFGMYDLNQIRNPMGKAAKNTFIRVFGAVEGENGYLESKWHERYWEIHDEKLELMSASSFQTPDLEAMFFKALEDHDENMRELREGAYRPGLAEDLLNEKTQEKEHRSGNKMTRAASE